MYPAATGFWFWRKICKTEKAFTFCSRKRPLQLKYNYFFQAEDGIRYPNKEATPVKNQMIFQRYEFKYLMDLRQLQAVLTAMAPYMVPDE